MSDNKKILHILSNTHWDREHRHGFQETRMMLVDAVDKLLDIIEHDPDFKSFTFDGQTVVLEDYLEIKPYMFETLKKHISSGKILIGPWYSLPDCTPANPESLVRNLLYGHRTAEQFGPVMKAGYSIFSFGQIGQLPQLYSGFDIDRLIFYKGAPDHMKNSEFIWEASDGTRALCSTLGTLNRLNFFALFTVPVILGGDMMNDGWSVSYNDPTNFCHYIDRENRGMNGTELKPDIRVRKEEIPKAIDDVLKSVQQSAASKNYLAFDGIDFSTPMKEIPKAIADSNEIMKDSLNIKHSNLVDYFDEFEKEVSRDDLEVLKGEGRFGPIGKIHSETLSGTMPIKQKMFLAERELLYYAEPFSVFSDPAFKKYKKEMFDFAWKYILKSQSHDSFHGAGVSKITSDTYYRLDQVIEIGGILSQKALENTVSAIDTNSLGQDGPFFTVFNAAPSSRSEAVRLCLEFPQEDHVSGFKITDALSGDAVDFEIVNSFQKNVPSINAENRPKAFYADVFETDLFVEDIPPYGYKTFIITPVKNPAPLPVNPFGEPYYRRDVIARHSRLLDNGVIAVTVEQDSSLTVYDYDAKRTYRNLNVFENSGDTGNVWVHNPPVYNTVLESRSLPHTVSVRESSSFRGELEIKIEFDLPQSVSHDRKSRSSSRQKTVLSSKVSLKRDSRFVEIKTSFENRVKDHKLSASMIPGIHADHTVSDYSFEYKKRPVDPVGEGMDPQKVIYRHPMQSFVDLSDQNGGVALMTKGLHEFETGSPDDPFVKLTLLRSVSQTFPVHTDVMIEASHEKSQCQGFQEFEYAYFIHEKAFAQSALRENSEIYQRPLRVMEHGKGGNGTAPLSQSFIQNDNPDVKILTVKKAEESGSMIVRLNNLGEKDVRERLTFTLDVKKIMMCNMNEEPKEEVAFSGKDVSITLKPYKIVTLKFDFKV